MKDFLKAHWILIASIAVFIIARIGLIMAHGVPYWDAAIYIGMGKYLFSHGAIGTWEILRPVALPIILGIFWKIGFDPYMVGTLLTLLITVGLFILTYVFTEDTRKGAGNIAVLLLMGSSVFFTYSAIPITDITSSFFALLALWLSYRATKSGQYLVAGIVVAIAFMFRFPQGLLLPATMAVVFVKMFYDPSSSEATTRQRKVSWNDRIVAMIERVFLIGGGFCIIVVPFLVANYYFYHNAFLPFIEGTASINNYPSLYNKGPWFYIVEMCKEDFFYVFSLIPIAMLWKKQYRSKAIIAITIALVIVSGYFMIYQTHKEIRYGLAFLPYAAILAGVGIMYVLEWTKMPRLLFFGVFLIAVFMVSVGMFVYRTGDPDAPMFYQFDTYLTHVPDGTHILTTSPYTLAYANVRVTHNLYGDWNAAYYDYNSFKSDNDYIMLNSCSLELGCADDGGHCTDHKQLLLDELKKEDTLVFNTTTPEPDRCVLEIYKIRH